MKYDIYELKNSSNSKLLIRGRKAVTNLDTIKKQRHYFAYKGPYSQSYGVPSGLVRMDVRIGL